MRNVYRPHPEAIWFWCRGTKRCEICRVGMIDRVGYVWKIFDYPYSSPIASGSSHSLTWSKKQVFEALGVPQEERQPRCY